MSIIKAAAYPTCISQSNRLSPLSLEDRCLKRIGYIGPTEHSLSTLQTLQRVFLLKVPFENLDIHLGRQISLSPESIYEKIVSRRRGGFCYECNILFYNLLNELGFKTEYLSARMVKGSTVGQEFDHMVILVNLEHNYLVDVGNGQSCREPLRIDGKNRAFSEGYTYRVGPYDKGYALYYQKPDTAWTPRFIFTLIPRDRTEFSGMCHYHQTSSESVFTQRRIVTIATKEGRITLTDMQLTITKGGKIEESILTSEDEYYENLKQYFGIEIDN